MKDLAILKRDKYLFNTNSYHQIGQLNIIPEQQHVELINGEIIKKEAITPRHAGTVLLLSNLLTKRIGNDLLINVQNPITLSKFSEPEPDLSILKYRADLYTSSHPKPIDALLLIEVADTSLQKDREIKLPLYASAGIKEVWIVNLEDRQIEISSSPTNKGYAKLHTYHPGDNIQHDLLGAIPVDEILIIPG